MVLRGLEMVVVQGEEDQKSQGWVYIVLRVICL